MNERMYRKIIMGALIVCALGAAALCPPKSRAAARDAKSVSVLEKSMLAASTKSIAYRKGKVKSKQMEPATFTSGGTGTVNGMVPPVRGLNTRAA